MIKKNKKKQPKKTLILSHLWRVLGEIHRCYDTIQSLFRFWSEAKQLR